MEIIARWHSRSEEETRQWGERLARDFLRPGDLVIVAGELGVGKTQLVKGIARGLGLQEEIKSPSFSLIHEYKKGDFTFYHLDFYRLEEEEEVVDLGWEEYREDEKGIMVVEWGDKFPTLFSPPLFLIRLSYGNGEQRDIEVYYDSCSG
ncbi:MAG TPA: tRNA (adenosine(37)-N6)-threonylcarbamoyltransferase complex ATPase subunit type 1 TsaE [Candidatus Atribacteria bacterium]|nr:tRNA (adenosine(37)-N6)-threonylcarbamoyltransferase complex ATPase subunit type 1 TsaE [Candidatus Atribacteria bacterium]